MDRRECVKPFLIAAIVFAAGCGGGPPETVRTDPPVPDDPFAGQVNIRTDDRPDLPDPPGMVWIPGGTFVMGSDGPEARPDESPLQLVTLTGYYMDVHEITNARFAEFVEATGYVTTAEQPPDREAILAQLPPGSVAPDPSLLVPGSVVFRMSEQPLITTGENDISRWWEWKPGACWRHPEGPESSITGRENHPVVHVSWHDAVAWCAWAGRQLPTEAQWEYAARGGLHQHSYGWGNDPVDDRHPQANIWQGQFPFRNAATDGWHTTAPVGQFSPNGFGLYDMAGNVWEWCSDWYRRDRIGESDRNPVVDPVGPAATDHPLEPRRVQRGGSFLCHRYYCSSYRPSARMSTSADTGLSHSGFRTVLSEAAWREQLQQAAEKNR